MNRLSNDLWYGIRMLLKTPSATATVLLALSLGIGLSALTFSLIQGAVLPMLPFEGGERIMRIDRAEHAPLTTRDYVTWASRQQSFERLGALEMDVVPLAIDGVSTGPVYAASITPSILPLLSVSPTLGRPFTEEDAAAGAPAVVLVSHDIWRDRLASDPDVLDRTVRVDGKPVQIVGVMPEGFGFPWNHQLWSPLEIDPLRADADITSSESKLVVGRVRPGVPAEDAAAELTALSRELDMENRSGMGAGSTVTVRGYTDLFNVPGRGGGLAALMLGVAFLVLLVACANVANVLLARTVARRRDTAIRLAIGASRLRIASQLWAEISLLVAAGAVGGVAIAVIGTRFVQAAMPGAGMPFWIDVRVNPGVLGFVVIVAALAALMAGLMPALQASRSNTHDVLKDDSRGSSSFYLGRVMRRLIAVEMALSFVLLVLAGLFVKSAVNFNATDFAFDPEEVYTARVRLPATYDDAAAQVRFADALHGTLDELSHVDGVSLATAVPGVGSAATTPVEVEGGDDVNPEEHRRTRSIVVTADFLEVFRTSPVTGRNFDSRDRAGAPPVAIVNEAFASRHFPGGALDRRIRLSEAEGNEEWLTIIGVTPDLMAGGVERELEEAVYLPLAQNPRSDIMIVARPVAGYASLPTPIRESLTTLDPDVALFDIRPLDEVIDLANSHFKWFSILFLISGGIALFLAAVGLYGVMGFWVNQRTREIGVRMALGGHRGSIVRLVLSQGMMQVSIGLAAGVLLAFPASQLLSVGLFGVRPYDPTVYGSILAVLLAAAGLGCWLPARRATRIDPVKALGA